MIHRNHLHNRLLLGAVVGFGLITAAGCGGSTAEPTPYVWQLPPGFPEPSVPDDNPMYEERVELGRMLFYDTRLSGNGTQACASCHHQDKAFSDGLATPHGSTGHPVPRNAPGLANVAYLATYTWSNPVLDTLEKQALVPLTGDNPVELGTGQALDQVRERLWEDPRYPELFKVAFAGEDEPFSLGNISKAVGSFQRTMLSGNAPYDRYLQGDNEALSPSAKRGMDLFFTERAECYHCHGGPHLTNSFRAKGGTPAGLQFENTGLYNVDGNGGYPLPNTGLFEFTGRPEDMGRFRIPPLRNVALTAPYMHDGSLATLKDVVDFYARGGRLVRTGPNAGDGRANPYKNSFVREFRLEPQEREDLIAFLESLTDPDFVKDPRFANPFE